MMNWLSYPCRPFREQVLPRAIGHPWGTAPETLRETLAGVCLPIARIPGIVSLCHLSSITESAHGYVNRVSETVIGVADLFRYHGY